MKQIALSTLVLIVLAFATSHAHAKYPPDGDGVAGKVLRVSNRYFIYDTNYGEIKVFVSANTHFQVDGRPATADQVKEGVAVRVTGHVTNDRVWESYKVNVTDQ